MLSKMVTKKKMIEWSTPTIVEKVSTILTDNWVFITRQLRGVSFGRMLLLSVVASGSSS